MSKVALIGFLSAGDEDGQRITGSPSRSSDLLTLRECECTWRRNALGLPTKLDSDMGNPHTITASSTPISTPSSSAFVATRPRIFPEKASCSIFRRSDG